MMAIIHGEHPYKWSPLKHKVIKDVELAEKIHQDGFAVLPLLNGDQLNQLKEIYQREHSLNVQNGGMFYSMYSSDNDYRFRIHEEIHAILKPILEEYFQNYKNVVNSFVVKSSGEQSEFYVHQDTTAVDEFKHSPLSLWIPLHDIDENNGALTVIEKTHWFFSPYRGVTFSFPFGKIINTVRKYLKPVYMKEGDVLMFDPRIIHNSMKNTSGKDRVAIICGVFDHDSEFITCYKDPSSETNPIELYRHDDDYVLKYSNFFYDCHVRPKSGEKFDEVEDVFPPMSSEQFDHLCQINNISEQNILDTESGIDCNMIAEPDGINKPELVCETAEPVPQEKKAKGFLSWLKR